jgi:hypothetical protein
MTTHQEDEIADTEPVQERGLDPIRIGSGHCDQLWNRNSTSRDDQKERSQSLPDCPARRFYRSWFRSSLSPGHFDLHQLS